MHSGFPFGCLGFGVVCLLFACCTSPAKAATAAPAAAEWMGEGPANGPIGFQAHSFNDLREWPQLFAKMEAAEAVGGGPQHKYIKIDPQYLEPAECAQQLRANHSDDRGCFGSETQLHHSILVVPLCLFSS